MTPKPHPKREGIVSNKMTELNRLCSDSIPPLRRLTSTESDPVFESKSLD